MSSTQISKRLLLRAPLLSREAFDSALRAKTRGELLKTLREWCLDPQIKFALRIASPQFAARLLKSGGTDRELDTLFKYFARASSRSVPFGLFATTSWIEAGDSPNTDLRFGERGTIEVVGSGLPDFTRRPKRFAKNPTLRDRNFWSYWRQLSGPAANTYEPGALHVTPATKSLVHRAAEAATSHAVAGKLYEANLLVDASSTPFVERSRRIEKEKTRLPERCDAIRKVEGTLNFGELGRRVEDVVQAWNVVESLAMRKSRAWQKVCELTYKFYDLNDVDFLEFVDRFAGELSQAQDAVRSTPDFAPFPAKILKAARDLTREVTLNETDLVKSQRTVGDISGDLLFQLHRKDGQLVYVLKHLFLGGAGKSMARFSALSNELESAYLEAAALNAIRPGSAEINQVARSRAFSVMQRRPTRYPKIDLFAKPSEHAIKLGDLSVSWDAGTLQLRRKSTGERVRPLICSAQTLDADPLPHVQALMLIETEGRIAQPLGSNVFMHSSFFSPRIRYKNVVLSRARWRLPTALVQNALETGTVAQLRSVYQLPQFLLFVSHGDAEVRIDLDHFSSAILLTSHPSPVTEFIESLDDEWSPAASSPDGSHSCELIVPFFSAGQAEPVAETRASQKTEARPPIISIAVELDEVAQRNFLVKLRRFMGRPFWFTRDERLNPLLQLRVGSFRSRSEAAKTRERLETFLDRKRLSGEIFDWDYRRYRAEHVQYGGNAALSMYEHISEIQCEAVCKIAERSFGDARLDFGVSSISFLSALYCAWHDLKMLETVLAEPVDLETLRGRKNSTSACARYCRSQTTALNKLFERGDGLDSSVLKVLRKRQAEMAEVLQRWPREPRRPLDVGHLYRRFTHMNLNRLLRADLSEIEGVVYDQVARFARFSELQRARGRR